MKTILNNGKNVILLFTFILIFNLVFGSEPTKYLLWLIILGMIIVNYKSVLEFLDKF